MHDEGKWPLPALLLRGRSTLSRRVAERRRPGQRQHIEIELAGLVLAPVLLGGRTADHEHQGEGGERGTPPQDQCGDRPFSFVVHGLWPQYERGFPEFCQVPAPRLDRNIVSSMLDLMPAPRLIFHEWDRHGTCSGLNARAYFDTVRKARAQVKIPEAYIELTRPLTVTPDEVEEAFVEANPGLSRDGIAVTCDSRRLQEVRICLSKELGFRECDETNRRACRRDKLVMPPVRQRRGAAVSEP